jgi:hypothetical protein
MSTAGKFATAESRWAGVGPYYAMFPTTFADNVVIKYSNPGDTVLDPLAGRGTSVYSASIHNRVGIGIELNPVGWLYARTKLDPAPEQHVRSRFIEIDRQSHRYREDANHLPQFFHRCFSARVLRFLLAARAGLDWKHKVIDRTAMAIILINLHGKREDSLSNQMRQTKAMSPQYAIRWWADRNLKPPEVDPLEFVLKRLEWRYAKGRPKGRPSRCLLGDSTKRLSDVARMVHTGKLAKVSLLFTSPPYYGITNYHYDQWLRLWLLGGPPSASRVAGRHRGKFSNLQRYEELLRTVFSKCAPLLSRNATVYVRTDSREVTYETTRRVLGEVFRCWRIRRRIRPVDRPTQTRLFGNNSPDSAEIDLIASRH